MNENSSIKLFLKYLIPSMLSTVFVSVYVITDTMMIGHGVGEDGLVALNIILPMFSLMYAIGYLFGIGGSVLMSVAKGQHDDKKADGIFTTSIIIVFSVAIIFTLFGSIFLKPIAVMLGADSDSMKLTLEYGRIMMATAFIYVLAPFFQSFVRNDNAPGRAMAAAVTGSLLNVFLDYVFIFIFHMGMTGAIAATFIGNAVNVIITVSYFFTGKCTLKFQKKLYNASYIGSIMKNGASGFLTEFCNAIVVFVYNRSILLNIGAEGIVIYSIISNTLIVVNAVMNGVAVAVQPILSYNVGKGCKDKVKTFKNIGFVTDLIFSFFMMTFIMILTKMCIYAFVSPSANVLNEGIPAIRTYFSGILFMCVNIYIGSYFQATVRPIQSFIIGILRSLIFTSVLAFLMPAIFGGNAVWIAAPVTEILTFIVTVILLIRFDLRRSLSENYGNI